MTNSATIRALSDPSAPGVVLDDALMLSWEITMRAERKSPRTILIYTTQARRYREWCDSVGLPHRFDRRGVITFLAAGAEAGLAGNTLRTRYRGLRQLANWLVAEGESEVMVMDGVKMPAAQTVPPPVLSDDDIKALLAACAGTRFYDRRDAAVLWVLIDSGARASEVVNLRVSDIDLRAGLATVVGKGDRVRRIPLGASAARALDRYLRMRRTHRYAASDRLWLGERGPWTYDGLSDALTVRAQRAGVEGFHAHLLRHSLAHRWLAAGGSETGLMDIAGWRSREMLDRYGAAARADRAVAEHQRLGLSEGLG